MDILLLVLGLVFICLGILGSLLPILPGPPLSWVGLLMIHLTKSVPMNWWFLGITLSVALIIFVLDYIIPAVGTKKFGGSKAGVIGTTIGLIVGLFFPPFGIIIGPFLGALIGELTNQADTQKALKAAFGSFLGFITGTFLKFIVSLIFLGLFFMKIWEYRDPLFTF